MRYIQIIFVLMFSGFVAQAQNMNSADTLPQPVGNDTIQPIDDFGQPPLFSLSKDKKLSVGMEMGTAFGVGSNSGGMFGVYAAPHFSYKISPRFRLNFGVRVENTNFLNYYNPYNPYFPEYTQTFDQNITRTLIYAEGQYLVNPRLMINTKVYKEVATFGEPKLNPHALDLDGGGVSVGFNYKINDNMHIGAEFSYSKGSNMYNPFYPTGPGMSPYSPFGIDRGSFFGRDPW